MCIRDRGSLARLASGRKARVTRVDDKTTDHATGDKTMLISVLCPTMRSASNTNDCSSAYDYELINSEYDGDVFAYLAEITGLATKLWSDMQGHKRVLEWYFNSSVSRLFFVSRNAFAVRDLEER